MEITYSLEPDLPSGEFREVLLRCMPEDAAPVLAVDRLNQMLRNADLVITARDRGRLVGVSRALTDCAYCCYLADLAVDVEYQRRGIGRQLVANTRFHAGECTNFIVVAFPAANGFYARLGLQQSSGCWCIPRAS